MEYDQQNKSGLDVSIILFAFLILNKQASFPVSNNYVSSHKN